ncbi:Retrovirus-related Pol polyprotein from transposon TNT 1-94 [Quillaja saponaria]|uniref:Retrovirus-related Pol polyprotein from transposon TNT 1-94 n=1 Tax=Quillaja saponaria TaxID=32244 RepID=A0AAD7LRD9_QUISA|nr:Retrovirus-related Pol polyprotein from transposon TNT 1-94 [Quillaja saponaria]
MLHAKNIPGRFWAEAMRTAAFVINRLPQKRLCFLSPFEKLRNMKPTVSYFRVFRCICYVFVPDHLRSKIDKKAIRCIFVGYDTQRKGWKCCDPTTGKCYTSRNVVFDESSSWWSSENEILPDSNDFEAELQTAQFQSTSNETKDVGDDGDDGDAEQGVAQNSWQTGVYQQPSEEGEHGEAEIPTQQSQPRRSTRIRKPNTKYANATIAKEVDAKEPETYEEASQNTVWIVAMEEEIAALEQNQTWELVPKPRDVKPISCKWVYKVKRCTDGSIKRYKARLVARGFT